MTSIPLHSPNTDSLPLLISREVCRPFVLPIRSGPTPCPFGLTTPHMGPCSRNLGWPALCSFCFNLHQMSEDGAFGCPTTLLGGASLSNFI